MEETSKPPAVEHSAEDDARLLGKAHEVRRDAKRMRAVKMHIRNMSKAISHGTVGRKGISHGLTNRIAAGKVGRKGMGRGLASKIAAGKVASRGKRSARHARGGR